MAVIACPKCGGKMSSLAPACPHCGDSTATAQPLPGKPPVAAAAGEMGSAPPACGHSQRALIAGAVLAGLSAVVCIAIYVAQKYFYVVIGWGVESYVSLFWLVPLLAAAAAGVVGVQVWRGRRADKRGE